MNNVDSGYDGDDDSANQGHIKGIIRGMPLQWPQIVVTTREM